MEPLTAREIEVVRLVAEGHRNKEIAKMLCITERTVRNHVSHILGKLGLASRSQLVKYAYENGLVNHPAADSPDQS